MKWLKTRDTITYHAFDPYLELSVCEQAEKPRITEAIWFIPGRSDPNTLCEGCKKVLYGRDEDNDKS